MRKLLNFFISGIFEKGQIWQFWPFQKGLNGNPVYFSLCEHPSHTDR